MSRKQKNELLVCCSFQSFCYFVLKWIETIDGNTIIVVHSTCGTSLLQALTDRLLLVCVNMTRRDGTSLTFGTAE